MGLYNEFTITCFVRMTRLCRMNRFNNDSITHKAIRCVLLETLRRLIGIWHHSYCESNSKAYRTVCSLIALVVLWCHTPVILRSAASSLTHLFTYLFPWINSHFSTNRLNERFNESPKAVNCFIPGWVCVFNDSVERMV